MSSIPIHKAEIFRPATIDELDAVIRRTRQKICYFAGATDLMSQNPHKVFSMPIIDLTQINDISQKIIIQEKRVVIGAAMALTDIISHPIIRDQFPILVKALELIGSKQIQNRATLGGNIGNASPAADSLPVLNVLNAMLLIGPRQDDRFGEIPCYKILRGPGKTALAKDQYIAYVTLPFDRNSGGFWYFRKVGQRQSMAISKVSLAVFGCYNDEIIKEIRISAGSVSPTVSRLFMVEALLKGRGLDETQIEKAAQLAEQLVKPITDIRSNKQYRKKIVGNLMREALYSLFNRNDLQTD
ncbi:MAG: xanthine dehydrogenase family protein subunit M [bacterium]|nr:xanthine dehydrogenase family protein subunit M [bacterium]